MRLDVFLTENGFTGSRTEAKGLIEKGAVTIQGKTVTKASTDVSGKEAFVMLDRSAIQYVSRGGIKLDGALCVFDVDVVGRDALDIGASSGGFTDCLLQHGARRVIALDTGSGQLVASLRSDARVSVIENYNARYLALRDLPYMPTLAVMDVSFISATLILPAVHTVLADAGDFICLVKPQFEVGRAGIGKGGIVKDARMREAALQKVVDAAKAIGFDALGAIQSPITGGDGNIEYLVHFRKTERV